MRQYTCRNINVVLDFKASKQASSFASKGAQNVNSADPFGSLQDATRAMLHWQHANLRQVVNSMSAEALNWAPIPEANSIAALIFHTLGAESELVAAAAGIIIEHYGTSYFQFEATSAEELVRLIDRMEQEIDGYLDQFREEHLSRTITRRGHSESGAWRLLHAVGHTREHVGQAQLTRQLWEHRKHQTTAI